MKIDVRYLYAIILITWAHLFAAISTYHAVTNLGASEGNLLAASVFNAIGIGPALILLYIIGTLLMISLPFILKEHENFKINATTISYSAMFIFLSADSIHDFLTLIGHPFSKVTYAVLVGYLSFSPYLIVAGITVIILYYSKKKLLEGI